MVKPRTKLLGPHGVSCTSCALVVPRVQNESIMSSWNSTIGIVASVVDFAETCASSLRVDESLSIWQTTVTTCKNLQEKLGDSGVSNLKEKLYSHLLHMARTNHPTSFHPWHEYAQTEVFRVGELQSVSLLLIHCTAVYN